MSSAGAAIRLVEVVKTYEEGNVRALRGVSFSIPAGGRAAITGPSGCGKSTLLNLLGGLDVADSGEIEVGGIRLAPGADLTNYRSSTVGFVFQLHNLIPVLTALENVQTPMLGPHGPPKAERRDRACALLEMVGLAGRANARPPQLSGGERQRVAVARALANEPGLILADEPTGALDQSTGRQVLDLLTRVSEEKGATLVLVTHDPAVAAAAESVIRLLDGLVCENREVGGA